MRHAKIVSPNSKFGHWYYPLKAKEHAKLFGLIYIPRLSQNIWHGTLAIILSSLAFASYKFSTGEAMAMSTLTTRTTWSWRAPLFGVSTVLSLFYFAQARTHGLIHNKADTVPWILFILTFAPDGNVCSSVRLLLGCVYLSSGVLKLRLTGLKWTKGESLQRLVLQFMLELRQSKANVPQRILLASPALSTISQCLALGFEIGFFFVVVVLTPALGSVSLTHFDTSLCYVLLASFFIFGCAFHLMVMLTMSIDFIRFWVPALFSVGVVPLLGFILQEDEAFLLCRSLPTLVQLFSASWQPWLLFVVFFVAHVRVHSGRHWPASSFDLYNNFYGSDSISYHGIDLLRKRGGTHTQWQPLDLSVCSSSGLTRSFGLHYTMMRKNGKRGRRDLREYLESFLPAYVAEQGWADGEFTGCRVVLLRAEYLRNSNKWLIYPGKLTGLEYDWETKH